MLSSRRKKVVYRPTARVLTVLELLQSHGRLTGAELARRLEVDIPTVPNYVETLADMAIPVEAERGRYGAYRLRPGYNLPPLIFAEDESLALTLSLLLAREGQCKGLVLGEDQRGEFVAWSQAIGPIAATLSFYWDAHIGKCFDVIAHRADIHLQPPSKLCAGQASM